MLLLLSSEKDPCDAECSPSATCHMEGDLMSCLCNDGYEGNGEVCIGEAVGVEPPADEFDSLQLAFHLT